MSATAPFALAHEGATTHVRFTPFERRFSYRLAQILIDIDHVADTAKALRLFSHNRFNLFSFHDADHGDRSGAPLRGWAETMFATAGVTLNGGRVELMCFPRMLGFVFNPLSIFFGYGADGRLAGVIYEVNNTFGETHAYVAAAGDNSSHAHETAKLFHVSPLFPVRGDYRFHIDTPGQRFRVTVENYVGGVREHLATLTTRARPLTDAWLAKIFVTMPLMTVGVVAAIHWEALKLLLKGARYYSRPALPEQSSSLALPRVQQTTEKELVDQTHE